MSTNKTQYALITGATNGIGYELAKLFAKDGYNLVIVARSSHELDRTSVELKQQYGIDVVKIAKDLFQRNAAVELYEEISDKQIKIDILVNDAGQGQYGKFHELDLERQLDLIHRLPLSQIAHAYDIFKQREDGCVKVVLDPWKD